MPDAQVSFAGNLTDDPEVRYTEGEIARRRAAADPPSSRRSTILA
jgi:single-stranded DNA-binding protein